MTSITRRLNRLETNSIVTWEPHHWPLIIVVRADPHDDEAATRAKIETAIGSKGDLIACRHNGR